MIVQRLLYGKIQPCELYQETVLENIRVEFVKYLWKGKEPVYFSFRKDAPFNCIVITTEYAGLPIFTKMALKDKKTKSIKIKRKQNAVSAK